MSANARSGPPARPRVPPEIKVEMVSRNDNVLPRIARIVGEAAARARAAGNPDQWLAKLQSYLSEGDGMVVHARMGRTLVGFLVLDSESGAAPFSWVDQRFRHKGLGERFYSFACINLARPTPEFKFPADMFEEYAGVIKSAGLQPSLRDAFYVVHEKAQALVVAAEQAEEPAPSKTEAPRRLVIQDGDWMGFSQHDARRLKIRYGRFAKKEP